MTQADMMSDAEKQITRQRQLEHMKRKMIDKNVSMSLSKPTRPKPKHKKVAKPKTTTNQSGPATERSEIENATEQAKSSSSESTRAHTNAEKSEDASISNRKSQTSHESTSLSENRSARVEPDAPINEKSATTSTTSRGSSAVTSTTKKLETADASTLQPELAPISVAEIGRARPIAPPSTSGSVSRRSSNQIDARAEGSVSGQSLNQTQPSLHDFSNTSPPPSPGPSPPPSPPPEREVLPHRRPDTAPSQSISAPLHRTRDPSSMSSVAPPIKQTGLDTSPQHATATVSRLSRDVASLPSGQMSANRLALPLPARARTWRGYIRWSASKVPVVARHVTGWNTAAETSSACALCKQPQGKLLTSARAVKCANTIGYLSGYLRGKSTVIQVLELQPDSGTEIGLSLGRVVPERMEHALR